MPVKIFRNKKFSTNHENEFFDKLIEKFYAHWSNSDELVVILANFFCNTLEIDALVVKSDSISVIDFKDYGGEITFSENAEWKANGKTIKGGNNKNPFQQIRNNKFELLNYLNSKSIVEKGKSINLGHISGIALFHKPIKIDNSSIPQKLSTWFHITDFDNIVKKLEQITSKEIYLNNEEIERFSTLFELTPYDSKKPKQNDKEVSLKNKILLLNELWNLNDLQLSLEIVENEYKKTIKQHNEFISYFYPKYKPKSQLDYNIKKYGLNYSNKQKQFIKEKTDRVYDQINKVNNLNTSNNYILNELIGNNNLSDYYDKFEKTSHLINKYIKKEKLGSEPEPIKINTIEAYKLILFERGIFDEKIFIKLEKEILKKEGLINNLHAIYIICRFWFADDMIKHGLETEQNVREHFYARGFSPKWKSNIEDKINNGKLLSSNINRVLFLSDKQLESINRFPDENLIENYESEKEDIIIEVEIPSYIYNLFNEVFLNLKTILTSEELEIILDFLKITWIRNKTISINDISLIELKTHLIYNLGDDSEFLSNKNDSKVYALSNTSIYEPVYISILEEFGLKFINNFSNNDEFEKSYLKLDKALVKKIDYIIDKWSLYKSLKWYWYKTNNDYSDCNRLNIGNSDGGWDYPGKNVSKELRITSEELESYLYRIKDIKLFGDYRYTGIGDRYYIQSLKKFKRLQCEKRTEKESELIKREIIENTIASKKIIGYDDIKEYVIDKIQPYIEPDNAKMFGLDRTAGILLYGPPGCGKTFWANWISKKLGLQFEEIFRSHIGSSFVDGAMNELNNKLNELEEKAPLVIFFDEFDSIGKARSSKSSSDSENQKVVNTLLQRIPKLIDKGIVIIAATNFLNDLDPAIIRPGRFDLHIPIFPPLPQERSNILVHYLTNESPVITEILINNFANSAEFWDNYSELMHLFSNSHVIDFCNEMKSYFFKLSKEIEITDIEISESIILDLIGKVKTKISGKVVLLYKQFLIESKNLETAFNERMLRLEFEIDSFYGQSDDNNKRIGFKLTK